MPPLCTDSGRGAAVSNGCDSHSGHTLPPVFWCKRGGFLISTKKFGNLADWESFAAVREVHMAVNSTTKVGSAPPQRGTPPLISASADRRTMANTRERYMDMHTHVCSVWDALADISM